MILNWILSLASAAMLILLFPPFSFTWLAPVALAPLLVACAREDRWKWRLAFGYAAGVVYWLGLCHWIEWTLEHHADMGAALGWLCFVLFSLAKGLQMGAFAVAAGLVVRKWFAAPAIAAMWVALEWTHSWTGFEWLNLGNVAGDMSLPLRLAPITGVWGVSFVVAIMSVVIACVVLAMTMKTRQHPAVWLLVLPALFLLPDLPAPHAGTAGAVVVQPNIDDESVWTEDLLKGTERQMRLFSLSVAGRNDATSIVVWPEVPAPFYESSPEFTTLLSSIARDAHAGVLAGVVARTPGTSKPLNSALLIGSDGRRISRYDKVNLVPFGEFVPWPLGLIAAKVSTESGDFVPGDHVVVSTLGDHRIGTFICYESAFPSYIRQFAASGAQVLFNISNDSWFGKTAARYQHLMLVRMRAVENNRWIVRSTNDGISGVIDPAGRVGRTLPEYQEASARLEYGYVSGQTFYTQHGDWFVLLCAIAAVAALVTAGRPPAPESLR